MCIQLNVQINLLIKLLYLQGILGSVQRDVFAFFHHIQCVVLHVENLEQFLHQQGTAWISSINKDIRVDFSRLKKHGHNLILEHTVVLEIIVTRQIFGQSYLFRDEDICLYKDFPHEQLVYPAIFFQHEMPNSSCTLFYLLQHVDIYLSDENLTARVRA